MMTLIFPASEKTATMDTRVLQLGEGSAMSHIATIVAECWTLVANPHDDL